MTLGKVQPFSFLHPIPMASINRAAAAGDLAMRRQQGKAVVTFSSLGAGKDEEELTSDSDTLLTPSPLTITARGTDLDMPGVPAHLLMGSVSPDPLQPSHQHTISPPCGEGGDTPALPASRHVPATPSLSSSEPSSFSSQVALKPDGRRTKLRVPASKLREIPTPRSVRPFAKTSPRQHIPPGEKHIQCVCSFLFLVLVANVSDAFSFQLWANVTAPCVCVCGYMYMVYCVCISTVFVVTKRSLLHSLWWFVFISIRHQK